MSDELKVMAELVSTSQDCRLRLLYIPYAEGWDFHSLSMEHIEGGEWLANTVITNEQFQSGCLNRRWVANLHSFLPQNGTAIIQVAEGNRPMDPTPMSTSFYYSWRRWDLKKNAELARLKDCESPFDPL